MERKFEEEIMKYPKYNVYEKLYKRFFSKGVQYLLDEADLRKEDKVLDICGGNGRLTRELVKKCEDVSYLDVERDMIPDDLSNLGIKVYNMTIEDMVEGTTQKYTKVFCEQAINYWLRSIDIQKFASMIECSGVFVFNTFSTKPSSSPLIKEYEIDGVAYLEISYVIGNKVEHIQVCEGYEPHFTEFDWISREEYMDILSPYFHIDLKDDGKSALYICRRK